VKVAVTGSRGFLGSNLKVRLAELNHDILEIDKNTSLLQLENSLAMCDVVIHLAGVNRPQNNDEFVRGNFDFTKSICETLSSGSPKPLVFSSSTQASLANPYGRSKLAAEEALAEYGRRCQVGTQSVRFPNLFGKWSKPHYNSAIATFCDALANDKTFTVHDPNAPLTLMYVDDAVEYLIASAKALLSGIETSGLEPVYETTVGYVADTLREFRDSTKTLSVGNVGTGLRRALYSTYVSFLPKEKFTYQVTLHSDPRGDFVEMLRTPDAGQFSYFTAHPGVTRGGHYHHSKTEKFLVLSGTARFRFRHLLTNERFETVVEGGKGTIVDTIPGWSHDIINIGSELLVVMLWANEIFDRNRPDTISAEL